MSEDGREASQRITGLEVEVKRLREENAQLKAEVERLRARESRPAPEVSDDYEQFIEAEGVLWKRAAGGGVERPPYCPACRLVLLPVPSDHPTKLVCTRCRLEAPFGPDEMHDVAGRVKG